MNVILPEFELNVPLNVKYIYLQTKKYTLNQNNDVIIFKFIPSYRYNICQKKVFVAEDLI